MVKSVLKCRVDHTWPGTSASLNYERFHGHQITLKPGTFYPFTLKVGSKYTYVILEALVRNQQICIPLQYRMRFPIPSYYNYMYKLFVYVFLEEN